MYTYIPSLLDFLPVQVTAETEWSSLSHIVGFHQLSILYIVSVLLLHRIKEGPSIPDVYAKLLQLCLTLCNPTDCSPPASSVHGILQARILEYVLQGTSTLDSYKQGQIWQQSTVLGPPTCQHSYMNKSSLYVLFPQVKKVTQEIMCSFFFLPQLRVQSSTQEISSQALTLGINILSFSSHGVWSFSYLNFVLYPMCFVTNCLESFKEIDRKYINMDAFVDSPTAAKCL